jgi:hypothetical protein
MAMAWARWIDAPRPPITVAVEALEHYLTCPACQAEVGDATVFIHFFQMIPMGISGKKVECNLASEFDFEVRYREYLGRFRS